jgi:hypothetical protein
VTEVFLNLTEIFPCFFLSCTANGRVKLAKAGHGPHSTTLVCICVVRMLLFVLFGCYLYCSMQCLCVNVYCHRVTTQLQLINIIIIIINNNIRNIGHTVEQLVEALRYKLEMSRVRFPMISLDFFKLHNPFGRTLTCTKKNKLHKMKLLLFKYRFPIYNCSNVNAEYVVYK